MKTKKIAKKLSLVKSTISNLNQMEQKGARGGEELPTWTQNPSGNPGCRFSDQCETFCLSNCETNHAYCTACTDLTNVTCP